MGEHINPDGEFQSDKYPWCKPGFVPLKITDKGAWQPLWDYAEQRQPIDIEFAEDLQACLKAAGFTPKPCTDAETLVLAAAAMLADHMTSDTHHPGYVLVPASALEAMRGVVAMPDDDITRCIACDKPMVAGDKYFPDASGGFIHAACLGPERECYTRDDEPLKDGDPIPEPYIWEEDPPRKPEASS